MPVKKITRKVISKKVASEALEQKSEPEVTEAADDAVKSVRQKKVCPFCKTKTVPFYTDIATLRRYLSDRAKIVPKLRSGLCSKHQRFATRQIKYARHLSLLPFTPGV